MDAGGVRQNEAGVGGRGDASRTKSLFLNMAPVISALLEPGASRLFAAQAHGAKSRGSADGSRAGGVTCGDLLLFVPAGTRRRCPQGAGDGALSHAALEDTCAYMAPESRAASVVSKDLSSVDAITHALACQRVTRIRIHVSLRVYV